MSFRIPAILAISLGLLLSGGAGAALTSAGSSAPEAAPLVQDDTEVTEYADNATIHVSTSADVSAPPDLAVIRLAVVATEDTAEVARDRVAEDVSDMRAALRDLGVEDDQVRTAYYEIGAVYEDTENGTEIDGYRAAHGFEIDVAASPDELGARTGTIIDTAVRNGANQLDGVQFRLAEDTRRELRDRALERAMTDARHDADVLARAGNLTITGVQSASTADVEVHSVEVGLRETADEASDTVIEPGPVTVSATVSVTYRAE